MPRQCTKSWLDTYLQYTQFQQAPQKFHLWTGLFLLAAATRRNVWLDRGYFRLYPNLYVAIIGPTGITKSTACDIGINTILDQIQPKLEIFRDKLTSYYLLEWFDQITKSTGQCCCTLYASEMRTMLSELNRSELVPILTAFYNCPDSPAYRTKGGGVYQFKNVCLNFFGASTPEWLTTGTTTDEVAGGFTGRFVYIYEDREDRSIAFPEDFITPEVLNWKQDLITDLQHIAQLQGRFVLTDQAKAEYVLWYNERRKEWTDERLIGYYSRKGDIVFKISMLLALARGDDLVIDESILHIAWNILEKAERRMGDAFSGVVDDPALRYKDIVLNMLRTAPKNTLARSELLKRNWNRLDGMILDRIVRNLEEAKMMRTHIKASETYYELIQQLKEGK